MYFPHFTNNFVFVFAGKPFNLTATVVSKYNLTSLDWSPPEHFGPLPNRTITVHHGNIIHMTLMLLKDTTRGDSGYYTLTAANKCGEKSLQVEVQVLTGKLMSNIISYVVTDTDIIKEIEKHFKWPVNKHNMASQK